MFVVRKRNAAKKHKSRVLFIFEGQIIHSQNNIQDLCKHKETN